MGTPYLTLGRATDTATLLLLLAMLLSGGMLSSCAGYTSGETTATPRSSPSPPSPPSSPPVTQANGYVNIRDYGAVGDGKHDDAPAILAAVNAAMNSDVQVVEFPATTADYQIGTPLVLPRPKRDWMRLNLDGRLNIGATVTVGGYYSIYGNNSDGQGQFSPEAGTRITISPAVDPAIHIVGNDVKLENLYLYFNAGGDGDALLIDTVCCITAENVSVNGQSGRNGVSVRIRGDGFSYVFDKGVYINQGSAPNFVIEGPEQCNTIGFLNMHDVILAGRGVHLNLSCGAAINYSFANILYEGFQESFLTIDAGPGLNNSVYGIEFHNILLADPVDPPAPFITNHNRATSGVQIFNSYLADGGSEVTGDPIHDLEIWSGAHVPVGQATDYVLHGPSGVISTMLPGATPSTRISPTAVPSLSVRGFFLRSRQ